MFFKGHIFYPMLFFGDLSIRHGVQVGPSRQGEVWEQAIPLRQDHDAHHWHGTHWRSQIQGLGWTENAMALGALGEKRGPTRCPSWIGWSSHLTHIGCEDIWFVAIDCKSFVQRVTWTVFLGEAILCILQSAVVFLATLAQQQVRLPQAGAPECDCGSKATIHLNIIFRGNDRA